MKLFAAIVIGSLETEMRIYEVGGRKGMKEIDCLSTRLNLGASAYAEGRLDAKQIDRLCEVLSAYRKAMEGYKVDDYTCYGTSALREIRSSLITKDYIEKQTGLKITIISNSEQRFLDYKSIASESVSFEKIIQNGTAIVDIGGNSMQISVFDKDKLVTTQRIPLGKVSTKERYEPHARNLPHYVEMVQEMIGHELSGFGKLYQKDRQISNLIVMDTDLVDVIRRQSELARNSGLKESETVYHVQADLFFQMCEEIMKMNVDDFSRRYQISADAASLAFQSMIFCQCLMEKLGAQTLWLMDVSICDGLCYDYGQRQKLLKTGHNFEEDILAEARNIAKRYKANSSHLKNVEENALKIFDRIRKVSGMGKRERLLLDIAAILHNCGKYISLTNVSDCAYNIIMATEIIGLSHAERQIIANVVRYNTAEFVYYDKLVQISDVTPAEYLVIAKLTAILRVANSLDRTHEQKFEGCSMSMKDGNLVISVSTAQDLTVEKLDMESQSSFFEEVFNIHPMICQKKKL